MNNRNIKIRYFILHKCLIYFSFNIIHFFIWFYNWNNYFCNGFIFLILNVLIWSQLGYGLFYFLLSISVNKEIIVLNRLIKWCIKIVKRKVLLIFFIRQLFLHTVIKWKKIREVCICFTLFWFAKCWIWPLFSPRNDDSILPFKLKWMRWSLFPFSLTYSRILLYWRCNTQHSWIRLNFLNVFIGSRVYFCYVGFQWFYVVQVILKLNCKLYLLDNKLRDFIFSL